MLVGLLGDTTTILYLCTAKFPDGALLQVKPACRNEFDVSMAWIEPATDQVRSVMLKAFSKAYQAMEWCAQEARSGKPRLSRLVQMAVVKGSPSKAKGARVNALKNGDRVGPRPQDPKQSGVTQKQNAPELKKAGANPEKSRPRQPKLVSTNQMALAYETARAKKTSQ